MVGQEKLRGRLLLTGSEDQPFNPGNPLYGSHNKARACQSQCFGNAGSALSLECDDLSTLSPAAARRRGLITLPHQSSESNEFSLRADSNS